MLTMHIRSDRYYVKQVMKGRKEAYAPLVDRYLGVLRAVIAARVDEPGDVDDAVQETFIRAYRSLGSLEKPGSFGAWVSTIARRTAYEFHHEQRRRREAQAILQRTAEETSEAPAESERIEVLRAELDRLPEDDRELLLMRYFAGKSVRDVAHLTGITPAAAAKRLQRARETLGERIIATLAQARAQDPRDAQRRRAVMGLIAPLPLPGLRTAAAHGAAVATVTSIMWKAGAVAVLITVAASVGIPLLKWTEPPARTSVSAVTADVVTETAHTASVPVAEPVEPAKSAAPEDVTTAAQTPGVPDLRGRWNLVVPMPSERQPDPESIAYVATQEGHQIVLTAQGERVPGYLATIMGTLNGSTLVLASSDPEDPDAALRFEGQFDADFTVATLEIYQYLGDFPEEKGLLVRPHVRNLPRDATEEHAATLANALRAYFDATGLLPPTLAALYPEYLVDASLVESRPGRELRYHPQNVPPREVVRPDVTPDMFDPDLPFPDRLMLCEKTLEEERNLRELFFPKPVVEITYTGDAPARYVILTWSDNRPLGVRSEGDLVREGAVRASCQNNLKQMGLVTYLFADDNQRYSPPGWYSAYPDFLADPAILRCPADPWGTDSYQLLFPATDWTLLAEELDCAVSELPLVVERAPRHTPSGRNVLFADGHVAFVKSGAEWERQVAPFLAHAAP